MVEDVKNRAGIAGVLGALIGAAVCIGLIAHYGPGEAHPAVVITIGVIAGVLAASVPAFMKLVKGRDRKGKSPHAKVGVGVIAAILAVDVEAAIVLGAVYGPAEVGKGALGGFIALTAIAVGAVVVQMAQESSRQKAEDDAAEQKVKQDLQRSEQAEFRDTALARLDTIAAAVGASDVPHHREQRPPRGIPPQGEV